ncbi:MAG: hypothetical protein KAT83_00915, partial [Candidatus Aenigmarchaeota archaeon]|nr:hypothetical protein [Candidatus Aenigmarchaeota archaeon]
MKSKTLVLAIVFILLSLSTLSQTISTPTWWDTSWNYRVGVEVNTTDYSRFNWPVEVDFNFTDSLLQKGSSGTFDINSTRVVEHNSTGGVMYELASQFDTLAGYDAASNAVGTIIFILNGSNPQNTKRYFYIYFDIEENGAKSPASYSSILNYSWDGEEFSVNNTNFQWLVDTIRAENTSGFYSARGSGNTIFKTVSTASKTKEYTEFQNGTTRLMFDFRNNATFTAGPLRLTVEQRGEEAYWNDPDNKTGEGFMVKKYIFYENISWMRIVTNFTNIVGQSINRSSTLAGATSFNEINSTEVFWPGGFPPASLWGNSTNPASWYGASKSGGAGMGIVHENQIGTSSYYIAYNSSANRMGASLNETAIPAGQSILQASVIHFNATDYNKPMINDFRDRIASPPNRTILSPDKLLFEIAASSNYSVYNRGEAALVFGNVTSDDYGQSSSVNATLDMGTPATGDDQTIILYDDGDSAHGDAVVGDKIFSNYFNITASNQTGTWNFTVYAYDAADDLLNTNSTTFNVTDEYTVVTFVENPLGISGRLINATINVENIRNDTYIPGAVLNCTYGAGQLTNITDYGNGTYRLNFTSPSITGAYTLNCTASKLNNTGWDTDSFYTEDATTDMNITFSPPYANISNITWYMPENFTFTINSTNTGNASARYTNITLYLPSVVSSGTTFAECGLVGIGASCVKSFNITVANQTLPGIYQINTTTSWENPDTTKSESNATFNISVLSNPKIEVPDNIVSGMVADGETQEVGFFNVTSFGNTNASNITFFVSGLPASFIVNFTPANISMIAPNNSNIVAVNVSVPVGQAPATYTGSINASSAGGGWDNLTLQIIVPPNTTMAVSVNPLYSNISGITWYASENFTFTVNSTNTGNASAKYANITLYLPSVASGPTFYECGNISRLSLCLKSFNITVANQTAPGIYQINTTTAWMNPDLTSGEANATFNISVLSNPKIEVPQTNITGIVGDGENQEVGSFNVTSFGNTNASNITFSVSGLPASFIVNFTPVNISTIAPNSTNIVAVNVTVPQIYEVGNYTGTVNVSAANDGYDTFVLNVSVPENRSWSRTPSSCEAAEADDEGPVCVITINNTGNAPIN